MTQMLFGDDYAGVPSVKITKGSIDPALEPDSNVGSFLYNSKWAKDYKLAGIDLMPYVGGPTFWPSGAGLSNYTKYTEVSLPTGSGEASYFRNGHFPALDYSLPLVDIKAKRISNGRFIGSMVRELIWGPTISGTRRAGNWYTPSQQWFGWGAGMTVYYNDTTGYHAAGTVVRNYFSWPGGVEAEPFYNNIAVWNLPGDETAILDGSPPAPVSGQHVIEIDSAGVRVAKPGFDLRSIMRPTQLAFNSANSPTKIIGAADIACPAGVSSYNIGVAIPPNAQADVFFYQGGTIVYPANPGIGNVYGAEYWFDGSSIYFNNPYAACRARFIVYANSTEGTTSGNNDVLRQFNDGTQEVFQILRPGASASPTFADIVVDSRWPCIQILAEGFLSVGAGELTHVVNFNGAGCFPMVKYMTVHGAGSNAGLVQSWSKRVRPPVMNVCANYNVGWAGQVAGDATYCELSANTAVFHTFRGNPTERYYLNGADYLAGKVSYTYDPSPLYGIRYYILGIPA